MHARMHKHTFTRTHARAHTHAHTLTRTHARVRTHVHTYTQTHMYFHTQVAQYSKELADRMPGNLKVRERNARALLHVLFIFFVLN